jgi:hypothetical protein
MDYAIAFVRALEQGRGNRPIQLTNKPISLLALRRGVSNKEYSYLLSQ